MHIFIFVYLSLGKCDKLASSHVGEVMLSSRQQLHTFLSYGIEPKDQTMALWSKSGSEYKQVASYTLDNPVSSLHIFVLFVCLISMSKVTFILNFQFFVDIPTQV